MKKTIAVIMTVHNRKDTTIRSLSRLFSNKGIESYTLKVYMVDDGSTDGTSEEVALLYPLVKVIHGSGSLFWNRGMYLCWKEASKKYHNYYLWLNDDTELYDDAISRLLKTSMKYKDMSIIVGSTHSRTKPEELTYGGVDKDNNRLLGIEQEQECYTFNGNVVLIPSAVFEVVGLNDPLFHHGAGDYDYGIRAHLNGFTNIVAKGYYGVCERHDELQKWQNPEVSVFYRLKYLFSLNGQTNPGDVFRYNLRYKGLFYAVKYFMICLFRVFFPKVFL